MQSLAILIQLAIGILSVYTKSWNSSQLFNCTIELKEYLKPQELVWFLSEYLSKDHISELDYFMRKTIESLQLTQTVVTNNSRNHMFGGPTKRNHISFMFTTSINDPIMEIFNQVLIGRHFYFAFVILVKTDMYLVYQLCEFLYLHNYVHTLIYFPNATGQYELYGVKRFPLYQIINHSNFKDYLIATFKEIANAVNNMEGYQFSTPLRQDLPHLFSYRNRQGIQLVEATTYRIIKTFLTLNNASVVDYKQASDALVGKVVNMRAVLELVRARKIEFSAHAYALFQSDDLVDKSYPLLVVKWCLMVPQYNSISSYFYLLVPFHWSVWYSVFVVFIALATLELLRLYYFNTLNMRCGFFQNVQWALLDNFCYALNLMTTKSLKYPPSYRFMYLSAIFFYGFFISANYTSLLGSILTVSTFNSQINTMQDIINAQMPVMIIDYELEFLVTEGYTYPPEFAALLRPVDSAIYVQHQSTFNKSFAYFVTEDHWQFLDKRQKHLKQRVFEFSDICFGSYHLSFPIQMESMLWRNLEYYIFRVHSSGLLFFYERRTFENALHGKLITRLPENRDYIAAGLQHLAFAFMYLVVMWTIALVCLLGELKWITLRIMFVKMSLKVRRFLE